MMNSIDYNFNRITQTEELQDNIKIQNNIISRSIPGDYIYTPSHVLFITAVGDTNGDGRNDYGGIKVSAHTTNRQNASLKSLYGSVPPSNMKFLRIDSVRWNEGI